MRLFKTLCMGCHAMSIRGIYGKHIAAGPEKYTSALTQKGMEKWTFKNLDAFLKHPKGFAPETAMGVAGIKSARDRKDIIEFLKA